MLEINKPASIGIKALDNISSRLQESPLPSQLLQILLGTFITIILLAITLTIAKAPTESIKELCKYIIYLAIGICLIASALDLLRIFMLRNEKNPVITEHNNVFAIHRGNIAN